VPLIRKKGSSFWWLDLPAGVYGKRRRESTKETSKTKALQYEAALIHKLSTGQSTGIRNRAPILRDYAKDFLAYVAATRRSDKTKEYYRNGWRLMESQNIAGMRLSAITTATAEVLQVPHSGSNVNCALRTLRRMLSLAVEKNLIAKAPKIPLVEEVQRDRLIGYDEEQIILAKAPRVLRDAYLLIADLGVRPDDAARLRSEHVDFATGLVFVTGGKTGKKAQRHIPMSDRVRAMLVERLGQDSEWVFPSVKSRRQGTHMRAHAISSRFSEFKKAVGFPDNLVLYSARHTFATDITEATGNLSKTQHALGHTSISTTARYNHTRSADVATIINVRNSTRHTFGHSTETVQ
jgi:integrase